MTPWIATKREVWQLFLPPAFLPYCDALLGTFGCVPAGCAVTCLGSGAEETVRRSGRAMALNSCVFHLFYKFKVLVLVTLCLMVLWATFSYFVDSRQEIAKAKSMMDHFRKVTSLEDSQKEEKIKSIAKVPTVKSFQDHCPALSPYLRKWWCFPLLSNKLRLLWYCWLIFFFPSCFTIKTLFL